MKVIQKHEFKDGKFIFTRTASDDLVYMCLFKLNSETETWKFVHEIR